MTVEATDVRPRSERLLRLCAVGLTAWVFVILLFLTTHVGMPEDVAIVLFLITCFPFLLPPLPGLTVALFVCFSMGIGLLAVGKAASPRAKWIVALAHFTAPIGFAAWWLTLRDSWAP